MEQDIKSNILTTMATSRITHYECSNSALGHRCYFPERFRSGLIEAFDSSILSPWITYRASKVITRCIG